MELDALPNSLNVLMQNCLNALMQDCWILFEHNDCYKISDPSESSLKERYSDKRFSDNISLYL